MRNPTRDRMRRNSTRNLNRDLNRNLDFRFGRDPEDPEENNFYSSAFL